MLADHNKALLATLESKYVTMLEAVNDIARFGMGNTQQQAELEKYIHSQQQAIHEAAGKLNHGAKASGVTSWTNNE